jgi:RHS repeat-associated protein
MKIVTTSNLQQRLGSSVRRSFSILGVAVVFALAMALSTEKAVADDAIPSALAMRPATSPGQSATLLPNGQWLLIGGTVNGEVVASISSSDGSEGVGFPAALNYARSGQSATVLPNGTVLVFGGTGPDGRLVAIPELVDPTAGTVQTLVIPGLMPRSNHTATLMTDGEVLFVGGLDESGTPLASAQLWNPATNGVDPTTASLQTPRYDHNAVLEPSGSDYIFGGTTGVPNIIPPPEQYNPITGLFEPTLGTNSESWPGIAASVPQDNAVDVAVDSSVAVRFNTPANVTQVNSSTFTLIGPNGAVAGRVVGAEGGMLAFFTPSIPLLPGSTYTLFIRGVTDASGMAVALSSIRFTTHRFIESTNQTASVPLTTGAVPAIVTQAPSKVSAPAVQKSAQAGNAVPIRQAPQEVPRVAPQQDDEPEDWLPQEANRHGQWRVLGVQGDPSLRIAPSAAQGLTAPAGVTAIAGQILKLNGKPLAGVVVSADGRSATTDASGRFLLSGVSAGVRLLKVDGTAVISNGRHYTEHYLRETVTSGATTVIPDSIYLPRVDPATEVSISSPADHEIVLTHPAIPGLEVHIPQGAVIRERDGQIVTKVSITPLPVDRPPYPTPVPFSTYVTLQPGGAYVDGDPSKAIKVIYPNYQGYAPGTTVDFWNYDPTNGGWQVYGHGVVSTNGKQVIPDEGVGFRQIMSFGLGIGANPLPNPGPKPNTCSKADPVDCASGLFSHTVTDLVVNDVIPISVTRMYRTNDNVSRAFGVGANLSYSMWLSITSQGVVFLVRGDGSLIEYDANGSNAYINETSPSEFFGSTLVLDGTTDVWHLTLRDGTVYSFYNAFFPNQLFSIADRNGNTVTITSLTNTGITSTAPPITQVTSPNGRFIQFFYDSCNRVVQAVDNTGRLVSYSYDSTTPPTCTGHLVVATDAAGFSEQYGYDPVSNGMNSITDKLGNVVTQNTFDGNGRVAQQQLADGSLWKFSYTLNTDSSVFQTTVTDPRGFVEQDTFNASGYITQQVMAVGAPEQQAYVFVRDPTTNLVSSITDGLNRQTTFTYDDFGDKTSVTSLAETDTALTYSFQYDSTYHQLTAFTDPLSHTTTVGLDQFGNVASVTDPLGQVTTVVNNSEGLPTRITDPLGHQIQLGYRGGDAVSITDALGRQALAFTDALGRLVSVSDAIGNQTQYVYDARDRITSVIDPQGGVTSLVFDANNNLLSMADPRQVVQTFVYDVRNRLQTYRDASGNFATYGYDGLSNLISFTDRKGQLTQVNYDGIDRPTQITYQDASTIGISWDAGNRPSSIIDSLNGTISQIYDQLDRLTRETTPQGQVGYTYDAEGRRQSMSIQGQPLINYTFDNANRLTQILQGSIGIEMTYDAANRRNTTTFPNGMVETYTYDAANELTALSYDSSGTHIGDMSYGYDLVGRRIAAGGSLAGFIPPASVPSMSYDAANRLINWGGTPLSYDANGNLTAFGSTTYTWNARNQLSATSAGAASFNYDAFGRRVGATVSGNISTYFYDGFNPATVSANVMLAGLNLDEIYAQITPSGTTSYLRDGENSTVALTDGNAAITSNYEYSPYGDTSGSGTSNTTLEFTGRENDGATGLYYYRNRYYSPQLARFISEDPIGLGGGTNFYAYANGNPINLIDPLGLASCWAFDCPSLPQGVVDTAAGIGDAALALFFLNGQSIRNALNINGGVNTCSGGYQVGQLAGIIGGFATPEGELNLVFKTEHYAARLIEAGVDVNGAEAAVAADLRALESMTEGELIKGQVSVDGQLLNYHAMPLPTGQVSVGTIHVPW